MAKDELTGLQAFDDLDPVSAVSELALLPEEAAPAPEPAPAARVPKQTLLGQPPVQAPRSVPPPSPSTAPRSVPPPSPSVAPRASGPSVPPPAASRPSRSVPPPSPSAAPRSVPPPAPGASVPPRRDPTMELDALDEITDLPGDTGQLAAAGSEGVAANLDMDWDDDNVRTRQANPFKGYSEDAPTQVVRNPALALDDGQPSPFPGGQPSPFGGAAPSEAPAVSPSQAPAYPSVEPAVIPASQVPTAVDMRGRSDLLPYGVGAAVVAALLAWLLLGGTEPGTATLVVSPIDAQVTLDGKVLEGSSPFTLLEIEPEIAHTLEVSADGYEAQTASFTLTDGETKSLSAVELVAIARDTGFALSSVPEGLQIVLDGQPTPHRTPARVLEVAPGMHTVQLTPPDGYAPFEIKVFVSDNQVLELSPAALVKAAPAPVAVAPVAVDPLEPAPAAPVAAPKKASSSSSAKARRAKRRAARRARRASGSSASRPVASSGGGMGTLRVNTRPWSKVFVDGRLIGNTPQFNIKLKAGSHTVKLVNDQMGLTKRLKVRVKGGQTVTKVINLIN